MERCSNCGAATRPGAKFCTSCGTRLNLDQDSAQPASASWNDEASTQETQVATPPIKWDEVTNDPPVSSSGESDDAVTSNDSDDESDVTETTSIVAAPAGESTTASSWASAWPTGTTAEPETTDETRAENEPASGNLTDAPESDDVPTEPDSSLTFPERNSWSWGNDSDNDTSVTIEESETFSPSTTTFKATSEETDDTVATVASSSTETPNVITGEPRERASALVDELRGLIWKIGEDETSNSGDNASIVSDLTNVRGATGDFSDLRSSIDAVRDNPRDIDALRDLGQQADRLQALLDSHSRLTSSLDDAIRKLR